MLRNVKLNVAVIFSIMLLFAFSCFYVVNVEGVSKEQKITIVVYLVTAAAAIVSAYFVVVGYLINVVVFEASQTPAIRAIIGNSIVTSNCGASEHITIINYSNLTRNMCEGLTISVAIKLNGTNEIYLPNLFPENMTLGPKDSRQRNFPTIRYLNDYVFGDSRHLQLTNSILTIKYTFPFAGRKISYACDYDWHDNDGWVLKMH